MHGYHVELVTFTNDEPTATATKSPIQQTDAIVHKSKQTTKWAQAAMAVAHQSQKGTANRTWQQAPAFKIGDKVCLAMKLRTKRPCENLDTKYARFTVIERISSHSYRLDTPLGIHNIFLAGLVTACCSKPLVLAGQNKRAAIVTARQQ